MVQSDNSVKTHNRISVYEENDNKSTMALVQKLTVGNIDTDGGSDGVKLG